LRHQRGACQRIANQLATEQDYDRVSIRPPTGSIILERASNGLDAESEAEKLRAILVHEVGDDGRPLIGAHAARGPLAATRLAEALVESARGLNADFCVALQGKADLGTLGPLALIAAGAAQVSLSGNLPIPPWSSLVWYAFRSFISFNPGAMGNGEVKSAGASAFDASESHDLVDGQEAHEGPSP